MTKISLAVVSAALAFGMQAPAWAFITDPEVIIYRFPGVRDDGGGIGAGVATVFFCTNFSPTSENIRFVTRQNNSPLLTNILVGIASLATKTVSTHATNAYNPDNTLGTGVVIQGTTAIAATSTNIICTAVTIEASSAFPLGVALRGIRFNPVPGSQE